MGHSFGTLLWDTLVGPSCRTLLWDTLVGHSCGTLLWDTPVGHTLRTRLPPKVTRQVSKTSVLYETSSKSHTSSLQNERFVRDFLQKSHVKSPKRAFRTRLPPKVTCQVPKTSVSYETSSNSHVKVCKTIVIWTYVAFRTCLHSGSWAPSCLMFKHTELKPRTPANALHRCLLLALPLTHQPVGESNLPVMPLHCEMATLRLPPSCRSWALIPARRRHGADGLSGTEVVQNSYDRGGRNGACVGVFGCSLCKIEAMYTVSLCACDALEGDLFPDAPCRKRRSIAMSM